MFQWADGGSLRDFYEQNKRPSLDPGFIKEIIKQLTGLADAVDALHNFGGDGSYRHGDLKPENILRFEDGTRVGILKIADMGLAKHHPMRTALRPIGTSTRFGTPSYEPPEVVTLSEAARSRLYDIWSMGCITLEVIVWLLYGYDAVLNFNNSLKTFPGNPSPYWESELQGEKRVAKVHSSVTACMDHIGQDPECVGSTALADLLKIVKTKLLVVALRKDTKTFRPDQNLSISSTGDQSPTVPTFQISEPGVVEDSLRRGPFRADAITFRSSLEEILSNGMNNDSYWYTGSARHGLDEKFNKLLSPKGLSARAPPADRARDVPQLAAQVSGLRAPIQRPDVRSHSSGSIYLPGEILTCF